MAGLFYRPSEPREEFGDGLLDELESSSEPTFLDFDGRLSE